MAHPSYVLSLLASFCIYAVRGATALVPSLLRPSHDFKIRADSSSSGNCFPSVGFKIPDDAPESPTDWWCDPSTEYAFMGFSYEVTPCTS
jgi:hypothetical protein